MKKLLLLPTVLFPYSILLWLAYGFGSGQFTGNPVMEGLGYACRACALLAPVCNIIYMILSGKQSATVLLEIALIVKLLHIPFYVLVFTLGCLMGFMFFMTFPFILMLVFIDCVVLLFSGMISIFSIIKNIKNRTVLSAFSIVCQFLFCADVISLFILFLTSKNKPHAISDNNTIDAEITKKEC